MKRRVVKKVEKGLMVDKICELQARIDEYERFLGDLLVMLSRKKSSIVIKHECGDYAGWIWDETERLIKENAALRSAASSGEKR